MKKIYFLLLLLISMQPSLLADDEPTQIYPESGTLDKALGYHDDSHVFISMDKLSSAVPGNIIRLYGWHTGEGAHKIGLGRQRPTIGGVEMPMLYLPGGELRDVVFVDGHYDIYITQDMLDTIRYGSGPRYGDLRVYGENITINRVELVTPGRTSLNGDYTVWIGYFWVDEWSTKFIDKATLTPYDFRFVRSIRFYHEAGRTDYIINLFQDNFEEGHKIAGSENDGMTLTDTYAELILTDAMREKLNGITSNLIVQGNRRLNDSSDPSAFNLTEIVFVLPFPDYVVTEENTLIEKDTVKNLIIYQGGSISNSEDINIAKSITYVYNASGTEGAKLGQWYTFSLPFTPTTVTVHDESDDADYAINSVYLNNSEGETDTNPLGAGSFYLQTFSTYDEEENAKWAYIENYGMPTKDTPYIIKFLSTSENSELASYFTNKEIKFIGGPQTISGTDDGTGGDAAGNFSFHVNKTLHKLELTNIYTLNEAEQTFEYDYGGPSTIMPFECYFRASSPAVANACPRIMIGRRTPEQNNTATPIENLAIDNNSPVLVYDLMGRLCYETLPASLPQGMWIIRQGQTTRTIVIP